VTRARGKSGVSAGGSSQTASAEVEEHCRQVRAGDRRAVAKAITLLESTRSDRASLGEQILESVVPKTGNAIRVLSPRMLPPVTGLLGSTARTATR
jgi:hypothetical protein